MIKLFIGVSIGILGGYMIGHYTQVGGSLLGEPEPEREDMPSIRRMSQDALFMIDNLRPLLVDIDEAFADGSLSLAESRGLYSHIQRLT